MYNVNQKILDAAGVAELVDATDSKSVGIYPVGVRFPSPALWFAREKRQEGGARRSVGERDKLKAKS